MKKIKLYPFLILVLLFVTSCDLPSITGVSDQPESVPTPALTPAPKGSWAENYREGVDGVGKTLGHKYGDTPEWKKKSVETCYNRSLPFYGSCAILEDVQKSLNQENQNQEPSKKP
jgi:hypothetical protein